MTEYAPLETLLFNDLAIRVSDVKQAEYQALQILKAYIDAKIEARLVESANDPEYTGAREREVLADAENNLNNLINQLSL